MRSIVKPLRSAFRIRVISAGSIPVIEAAFRFERFRSLRIPIISAASVARGIFQFRIGKANVPKGVITAAYDFESFFFHRIYSFNHCILSFITSMFCLGVEMPFLDFF